MGESRRYRHHRQQSPRRGSGGIRALTRLVNPHLPTSDTCRRRCGYNADLDALCRQEPFVARGYREYEVIAWDVHQLLGIGGFDVKTIAAMTAGGDDGN